MKKEILPKPMDISELLRREYLRGVIDGQEIKLPKKYTLLDLDKIYKKYLKLNKI